MPITIKEDTARQRPIMVEVSFGVGDLVDAALEIAFQLPPTAVVVGGQVIVDTVWNSVTSDGLDVGDAVTPNRYTSTAADMQVVGATALTLTGWKYTDNTNIIVEINSVGGSLTTGAARLQLWYVYDAEVTEIHKVR